ncbi:hypothetical protein PBY51_003894 [Eleginops maclovinus]|uniref:Uncharacterized protein n=1 Tax=Eleginops maclovinus TaxID=56733 RepID=A0AAN7XVS6_ELEMC|nr:hypothetical protein PBY51_003894 [Eleginops maclovinus]
MQSDAPGDRNSSHFTDSHKHMAVNTIQKTCSPPVFTGIRLLYLMLLVMLPALLPRFHQSDGSQKAAPCLASKSPDRQQEGGPS